MFILVSRVLVRHLYITYLNRQTRFTGEDTVVFIARLNYYNGAQPMSVQSLHLTHMVLFGYI